MRRGTSWKIWGFFAGSALVLGAGTVRLTTSQLELERQKAVAEQVARFHADLRLALWRMDSAINPIIAREASRPYYEYNPFYAPDHAYTRRWTEIRAGQVLVPSPLLQQPVDWIKLHFQIAPDGAWSSPQVPHGAMRSLVDGLGLPAGTVAAKAALLEDLQRRADAARFRKGIPDWESDPGRDVVVAYERRRPASQSRSRVANGNGVSEAVQRQNLKEYDRRARLTARTQFRFSRRVTLRPESLIANIGADDPAVAGDPVEVRQTHFVAYWVVGRQGKLHLFYLRGVSAGGEPHVQGFWIDWPRLQTALLDEVRDLFPQARLLPLPRTGLQDPSPALTSIPAWIASPMPEPPAMPRFTPVRISLGFLWIALIAGLAAVGLGLRSLTELSERRLDFVSAVTHELRTPLTTFRMYSEMLADGMVRDPERRAEYCRTLQREAERLSQLVANVLDYSRLERKAWKPKLVALPAGDLLQRLAERVRSCCAAAGMELVAENATAEGSTVTTDPEAVEQIIYNLVDNACKYAGGADDRRVHLRARDIEGGIAIEVADHGEGVDPDLASRIFGAFSRGMREAHRSQPGVGLGLALCRRWARALGARLILADNSSRGACFRLTLH